MRYENHWQTAKQILRLQQNCSNTESTSGDEDSEDSSEDSEGGSLNHRKIYTPTGSTDSLKSFNANDRVAEKPYESNEGGISTDDVDVLINALDGESLNE